MDFEQDYIDLFLHKRKGHMGKYTYMYRPDVYDKISQQEDYYPFRMESELIAQTSDAICKNFKDVRHVLEFGPGSQIPILAKTVPFLKALKAHNDSFIYTAMDSMPEYAEGACSLVKQHLDGIETNPLVLDLTEANTFHQSNKDKTVQGTKLFVSFGQPIFANNSDQEIEIELRNIGNLLNEGDYFVFGIDTNLDESLLDKAYNTKCFHEFLLNVMHYLKISLNLKDFDSEAFELVCRWNAAETRVELCLKALNRQTIKVKSKIITIEVGQVFNLLNSRRESIKNIEKKLGQNHLIVENLMMPNSNQNNTFCMVVAKKQSNVQKNLAFSKNLCFINNRSLLKKMR
jgi:L-histidine Nalpha-methyltransferase